MIDYIDEMYRDLARDIRRTRLLYPSKSQEYKYMMQDLSRGNAKTIVPDIEYSGADILQLKDIVYTMPPNYLRFFFFYYVRQFSRAKKMKELGFAKKEDYYKMRDALHTYTLGRLDAVEYHKLSQIV